MALSWQTPLATAGGISGYRIERSADVEPRVWVEQVADTGTTATTWTDSGLSADTVVHYRVTGRNAAGLGTAATATGRTRPRLALNATATYPLTAHAWPLATAPTTHTWTAHDATVALDVRGQAPGWWRVVRYGQGASGPYWLPSQCGHGDGRDHGSVPAGAGAARGPGGLQATHDTCDPDLDGADHRGSGDRLPAVAAERRSGLQRTGGRPGGGRPEPYGHDGDVPAPPTSTACRPCRRPGPGCARRP